MKALIQRVTTAKVTGNFHWNEFNWINIVLCVFLSEFSTVNDELISNIGRGLCVLIGISQNDTKEEVDYMWVARP